MTHWALALLGKPWRAGANGPDAFDCWGLVRYVFAEQKGIHFPEVNEPDNRGVILGIAREHGFRRVQECQGWDIVIFDRPGDGKHVGVVLSVTDGLRFLHAPGSESQAGYVVAQPIGDVLRAPRNGMEIWRQVR